MKTVPNVFACQRRPGPSFHESASFNLANLFLWCAVFVALLGLSVFFFYAEGSMEGPAALLYGAVLMGLLFAIVGASVLGSIFALVAVSRAKDRRRLWPVGVPLVLLAMYIVVAATMVGRSGELVEGQSWLLFHILGFVAIAAFAALWLARVNIVMGLLVALVFLMFSIRHDVTQYWTLNRLMEIRDGLSAWKAAREEEDVTVILPRWLELAVSVSYRTYKLRVDVGPDDLVTDPRVHISFIPRLFGRSATSVVTMALPVEDSRVLSMTVPDFVVVSGPDGVMGAHAKREGSRVIARIFGNDGASPPPWLRVDGINRMNCVVHDLAIGDCEIVSDID